MNGFDISVTSSLSRQSNHICQYLLIFISILLGFSCFAGFIVISIQFNSDSNTRTHCKQNQTQDYIFCYIRSIISDGSYTQWNRLVLVTLLLTYASVFLHIIVETSRTNIRGLLGLMILQTTCLIFGIGFCFPAIFIPSFIYFYKLKRFSTKSSVPIDIVILGFIYVLCFIILPTYLAYFYLKNDTILTIMSIILLISPLGFVFISFPFRFCSKYFLRCWIINSHRLIVQCQLCLFIISTPLFFITLVAYIEHFSIDLWKQSYVTEISNQINRIALIWSIDFLSLYLSLIFYLILNEYLFSHTNNQYRFSLIKNLMFYSFIFLLFIIMPCLIFPLYVAWKEYQYLRQI